MEIVSYPDMRCAEEAAAYVKKVRTILRYLGTCDGDMEKGNLPRRRERLGAPARRSARHPLRDQNVNSYRYIQQAIEYEARRQIEILEDGGKIAQETRLFDPGRGETPLDALQGRGARLPLLPRSDLLPLVLDPAWVKAIEATLPELPDDRRRRLMDQYGLSATTPACW